MDRAAQADQADRVAAVANTVQIVKLAETHVFLGAIPAINRQDAHAHKSSLRLC